MIMHFLGRSSALAAAAAAVPVFMGLLYIMIAAAACQHLLCNTAVNVLRQSVCCFVECRRLRGISSNT
jgi:hypothetical protein